MWTIRLQHYTLHALDSATIPKLAVYGVLEGVTVHTSVTRTEPQSSRLLLPGRLSAIDIDKQP